MEPLVDPNLEKYAEEHSSEVPELLERLDRETLASMKGSVGGFVKYSRPCRTAISVQLLRSAEP